MKFRRNGLAAIGIFLIMFQVPDSHAGWIESTSRWFDENMIDAEDGKLDMDTLYRNARALDPEDAREVALDALRAFFDYAQFQTMDVLDDDACDRMMNKLHKIRSAMDE